MRDGSVRKSAQRSRAGRQAQGGGGGDDERRRHPRGEMDAQAEVLRDGHWMGHYRCQDLSAGGMRLLGPSGLKPGDRVDLTLTLPNRRPVELGCHVRHADAAGTGSARYGVEFHGLDADVEDVIQTALLSALERASGTGRPRLLLVYKAGPQQVTLEREARSLGWDVTWVDHNDDVRSFLDDPSQSFEAVVVGSDIERNTPEGVLDLINECAPSARRVLVTGTARAGLANLALVAGRVSAVLPTPWDRDALDEALGAA